MTFYQNPVNNLNNSIWENVEILKSIVQSSPIAIVVLNKVGQVRLMNYGAESMFGWKEEEVLGEIFPILLKEETVLDRLINEDFIVSEEASFQKRTGLLIDTNYSSVRLYDTEENFIGILVIFKDVSKRKKAEVVLKQSLKEIKDIKFALDQSSIIAITDPNGCIRYVNNKFCEISKYSRQELLGQDHRIVNSGYHPKEFFTDMWDTIISGDVWKGEVKNRAKDGELYWVHTTIVPFLNSDGKPYQYVSIRTDISERKKAEERVNYLAYFDELTDLPNRRLFIQKLKQVLKNAQSSNEEVAILCIDLDRFKMINDTLGHRYGDLMLRLVAERIKGCLKSEDMIARYGGDEFIIFLRDVDIEKTKKVARAIINSLDVAFHLGKSQHFTSGSIGISRYPFDGETIEELVQKADIAINRVKSQGKNHFQFFENNMDHVITREMKIERNLHNAIKNNELELYYQPKMDLSTLEIVGMEALLRWKNEELGNVSPGEFIPIAEESGIIISLGEWVFRNACLQVKKWQDKEVMQLCVSINLSIRQFRDPNIVEMISEVIRETNIPPGLLELELTENIAIHERNFVHQKLHDIRSLGVKISIDDFGTGYSSLSYLKDYPIDTLKIDKSFVDDIFKTGESSIVRAIIAMAHSMSLTVVAEGVEMKEQLDYLKRYRCNTIQGYIVSRPLPADEFEEQFLRY